MDINVSKKFSVLFSQLKKGLLNRFYVFYGGRSSGKSWAVAIFIVLMMRIKKYRVLCTREFQKNIAHSSKKLIEDTIKRFGWDSEFDMQRTTTINKRTGAEVLYYGLHHNVTEIKSLEGVDICWCEESENTSRESLDVLIPTIRKEKSIIIFTLNPDKKENPVYQEFIGTDSYDGLIREKVNYSNNIHFPEVMRLEMERARERDPEKYDWVWLGNCREHSDAQIFKGCYSIKDFELPDDTVFTFGADWGFSQDPNTLTRLSVDMDNKKLYIDYAVSMVGCEIGDTPKFFEQIPRVREFKIIADSARPELISYMRNQGFKISGSKKGKHSIEDGIEFMRDFDIIVHPRCKPLIEELKLYSYKVNRVTGQILNTIEDNHNHVIDACFKGNTLVKVNGRVMEIKDIPSNGYIMGFDGEYREYINGGFIRCDKVLSVKLKDGTIIESTADHKFLTLNGLVDAIDLKGETLCQTVNISMERSSLNIRENAIIEEEQHLCTELYGNISMGRYLRVWISTIKTMIKKITTFGILRLLVGLSIYHTMQPNMLERIRIRLEETLTGSDLLQANGTGRRTAERGIKNNIINTVTYSERRLLKIALVVLKSLLDIRERLIYFARTNAKVLIEEKQVSTISKQNASNVAICLQPTSIQKQKRVVEVVQTGCGLLEKTYCVTVKGNELFSLYNGCIVSNCRYALELYRPNKTKRRKYI